LFTVCSVQVNTVLLSMGLVSQMAKQCKAYRFRLEPTSQQEEGLRRIAGACRAVYNWGLGRCKEHYAEQGKTLPYAAQNLELTALKNRPGLEWLKEADSQALQESLRDLDRAFVNFFEKRARFPKFKRAKDERFAFRIPQRVKVEGERVYCPKIGWIDLRLSRPVEGVTKSASFKRDAAGHWHVCLIQEFELPEVALPAPQNPVGVDVGLIDFATLSTGESIPAPKFARKADRRVRCAQRVVSRRKKGSNRRKKAKRRLSRVHQQVARQRNDFVHKVTTGLVGRFDLICIEDLSVKGIARTKLARLVMDAAFGEFRRQLEYKTLWNYRRLVTADRFFPSSKQCHACGARNGELTLSDRVWACGCGAVHRRDLNAALNLEVEGMRLVAVGQTETQNARGVARKTWEARQCGIEARIPRL
jgi:putative transposase